MNLLITFLITVSIGIFGAAWVGVLVDKMTSPFVSLLQTNTMAVHGAAASRIRPAM